MDIITNNKQKKYKKLTTLLILHINGDGEEIFEYNLPYPNAYTRLNEQEYIIEYYLRGVFWTKNSIEFLNDILLRFNISMQIKSVETKVINQVENELELKMFSSSSNLKSLSKTVFNPNAYKHNDSVFWGIKLFVEHYIRKHKVNFIAYDTIFNFAYTHYVDHVKDFSTLKAKCRSIWNYYNEREWTTQLEYTKKDKEEVMATRLEHVQNLAQQKTTRTKILIKGAIEELKKQNKKITNTNIISITKLNKNTLTKYKDYIQSFK